MASGRPSGTHPCPGKCGSKVRRTLFACRSCWGRLPSELRELIVDNHLLNPVAHLAAMNVACDWYRANPLPGQGPGPVGERENRCGLTELLVTQCAHCKGGRGVEQELLDVRARLLATPRWIPAECAGDCDVCGDPFVPGTAIRKSGNGWRAECCADDGGDSRA